MTKVMRYENGKAIAGQVDAPFKVDWSDWINMTDAQKKGKKWLIENVPGAEGEIDAELFTPLWTNPSPTAAFAAQNITLASDDYDFLLILYTYAGDSHMSCQIARKGQSVNLFTCGSTTVGTRVNNRSCDYVSDTSLSFGEGRQATGTSAAIAEHYVCTPMQIYGFKKTVKIKFDALAKDVSTLASKCMLEDGETSVEEALNEKLNNTDFEVRRVTNTTTAVGQIFLGGNVSNEYIISAMAVGYVVIPFKGESGWNAVVESYTNGQRVANTSITVEYIVKIKTS